MQWTRPAALLLFIAALIGLVAVSPGAVSGATGQAGLAADEAALQLSTNCADCHESATPAIYDQYRDSEHAEMGVSCDDCHQADPADPSSAEHGGEVVSVLVTPEDCADCHDNEVSQFRNSLHDEAALFSATAMAEGDVPDSHPEVGENANALTHFSTASAQSGCQECHGSAVTVRNQTNPGGPEPSIEDVEIANFPNQGIGRLNPDGSAGSCSSCHTNHEFSVAQAREPGACSECHLGPDHPQTEIYEETKHASLFEHNEEHYNMSVDEPTASDIGAPTCAICHMTGLGSSATTHDVSSRLYWELEPVYSWPTDERYLTGEQAYELPADVRTRIADRYDVDPATLESVPTGAPNPFAIMKANQPALYEEYVGEDKWFDVGENPTRWDALDGASARSADAKRARMESVCTECHTDRWVEESFEKRDRVPPLNDAVFAAADSQYYQPIADKAPEAGPYDRSHVDQIRFEMWHHEGRRWRMGALMQGQDYEHWHGSYEVLGDVTELAHIKAMLNRTAPSQTAEPETTPGTNPTTTAGADGQSGPGETTRPTRASTPGFGPAAVLVALLGAVALAGRRFG